MSKWKTSEETVEMGLSRSMGRKTDMAADNKLVNSFAFGTTPYFYINDNVLGEEFFSKMDFFFY